MTTVKVDGEEVNVELALRLEQALDMAILAFAREHGPLVRLACGAPDEADLSIAVTCSFLGHTLARMRRLQGTDRTRTIVLRLIEQFAAIDGMRAASAPSGEADAEPDPSFHGSGGVD